MLCRPSVSSPQAVSLWGRLLASRYHIESILDSHAGQLDAVIVAGGSPCQQISAAGSSPGGLAGRDSGLFWEFARVAALLGVACSKRNVPLWRLFENVVGPRDVVSTISDMMGFLPVRTESADLGWCNRKRLIWRDASVPHE